MADVSQTKYFARDIQQLRDAAKQSLEEGALTKNCRGDAKKMIELLQTALATEIVRVLRYTMNAISVRGINSKSVAAEFKEHAADETARMTLIAERIDELGGEPNFNPKVLDERSAGEYGGGTLAETVQQNLVAERIAIERYPGLIRYFADKDPTTRVMLEGILVNEEDHATDRHDLLVAHEGTPMLS